MVTISSVPHPLPVGIGNTLVASKKKISKLLFQMSVQVYFLLDETDGDRKAFFGRLQEGGLYCAIISKSTWLL